MSSKRNADMAEIAAAIDAGVSKRVDESLYRSQVANELATRGQLTDDETIDSTIADANKQREEDEKLANADQALELKKRSLLKAQFRKVHQTSGEAIRGFQNGVGRVPMPTGLWVPFLAWLVLFMLLVKVNGNSRAGWAWLVITGNAALPDSVGASGDFGNGTGTGGGDPENGKASGAKPAIPMQMYTPDLTQYLPEMDEW